MDRLQAVAPSLALLGAVLGFVALIGWWLLYRRFQGFSRPYEELLRAVEKEGAPAALQAQLLGLERNEKNIGATHAYARQIETQLHTALQGVGFLKYDAFEDIRGQQSYSLCLLDAHQNGVIMTSIAGRNDYRGYAKPVKRGSCDLAMSDEEKQALEMAKGTLVAEPAPAPPVAEPAAV